MKYLFCFWLIFIISTGSTQAQDFITRGKIEFEIKTHTKSMYSAADLANNSFLSSLPEFDISYRDLIFSWNRSVYQQGRKGITTSLWANDNEVFTDLDKQQSIKKINQTGEQYIVEDSVKKTKWKIQNETRKIAGFTCRKAVGRIYDSVYVVAFYCAEIVPQGGPELFSGLPGMILGLAIPREYTTWFATKIELANVDESKIVPPVSKKSKQYTVKELADILFKKYKDTGVWKDVTPEKVKNSISGYTL